MTMGRRYVLRLSQNDGHVDAEIERLGPADVMQVGVGRLADEAPRLTSLLFTLCPRAHSAAALFAIEHAAGIALPVGQTAARDTVLLAEAVSSALWRAGIGWAQYLGIEPDPQTVKRGRLAADGLVSALFMGDWARIGGAMMNPDDERIKTYVSDLAKAAGQLEAATEQITRHSERVAARSLCDTLQDDIWTTSVHPDQSCLEETPRALTAHHARSTTLAAWFEAHHRYVGLLVEKLRVAVDTVSVARPVSVPAMISGDGIGVVMTARGRLRHALSLKDGRIARWCVAAPTDWNFAPKGPVAHMAGALEPGHDLKHRAGCLVSAFDPCAPCEIVVEDRHA